MGLGSRAVGRRPLLTLQAPRRRSSAGLRLVGAYVGLAVLVAAVAVGLRGSVPWAHPTPRWELEPRLAIALSIMAGLSGAALVVAFTRFAVRYFAWARALAEQLRPAAWSLTTPQIGAVAFASAFAEELLFRAVLVPWLGVFVSSVAFGLAHQMKGPARWAWVLWSSVVGLGLGGLYEATGSLWGPIAAHAAINAVNLAWLRAGAWRNADSLRPGAPRFSPT